MVKIVGNLFPGEYTDIQLEDLLIQNPHLKVVKINDTLCRLVDPGLERYKKQQLTKPKKVSLKEVQLSPNISPFDLERKINDAKKFLDDKNQVKLRLVAKGRDRSESLRSKSTLVVQSFLESLGRKDNIPRMGDNGQIVLILK